jgi:hypothetical protein
MVDPYRHLRTLLAPQAGWHLNLYPGAFEAGGSFQPSLRAPSTYVPGTPAADPERARQEAGRRARTRLRRYCVANGLNRLVTLTYEGSGCHDERQVRADVGRFVRSLRRSLGDKPLPYVWVPEWHKTDHGLHMHLALGRYVPRGLLKAAWDVPGAGFVHIKLLGDLPVGSGRVAEARKAAGYLGKYVGKSFGEHQRSRSLKRYEVAEGFAPQVLHLTGRSADEVTEMACEHMQAVPSSSWNSREVEDWKGAPAISLRWS